MKSQHSISSYITIKNNQKKWSEDKETIFNSSTLDVIYNKWAHHGQSILHLGSSETPTNVPK